MNEKFDNLDLDVEEAQIEEEDSHSFTYEEASLEEKPEKKKSRKNKKEEADPSKYVLPTAEEKAKKKKWPFMFLGIVFLLLIVVLLTSKSSENNSQEPGPFIDSNNTVESNPALVKTEELFSLDASNENQSIVYLKERLGENPVQFVPEPAQIEKSVLRLNSLIKTMPKKPTYSYFDKKLANYQKGGLPKENEISVAISDTRIIVLVGANDSYSVGQDLTLPIRLRPTASVKAAMAQANDVETNNIRL